MTFSAHPLLLACSPRHGGNSDSVLAHVRERIYEPEAAAPPVTYLRDHSVLPCISCGHCERHDGQCPLTPRDDSGILFTALETAPALVIAAPFYFTPIPAQLRGLVHRSQPVWSRRYVWKRPLPPRRPAHIILVGARRQGEKLFEGSLLTFKYWLELFGYELADPLTLYGLEGPDAFSRVPGQREAATRYADALRAGLARPEE